MSKRTNIRSKKISIKQALKVFQFPEIDEDSLQNAAPAVESGVDKEEENEKHLRDAIESNHNKPVYIPTPDASRVVPGYDKKFRKPYSLPGSRIRFSATVEDCEGCPYSMDETDDEWLVKFNTGKSDNTRISEDAFEWIVYQFESAINTKQPFLSTAPESILSFEELESAFDEEQSVAKPYKAFAKFVYPHWRTRRVANLGKPIMPLLRYEENAKDDGDPYVCFRRREIRQVRKTRQTGQSATVRLRNLRTELQQARDMAEMVLKREQLKRASLLADQALFEQRCLVKDLKRKLGIKGEDEDLISFKRRKSVDIPPATVQRSARPTPRADGDNTLVSLDDYFAERELKHKDSIAEQLYDLKQKDLGWCDHTNNPFVPLPESVPNSFFRSIRTYFVTEGGRGGKGKGGKSKTPIKHIQGAKRRPMFRQRIGRGGRLMIDRRGFGYMKQDKENSRWAFDRDSDLEDEGVEIDVV